MFWNLIYNGDGIKIITLSMWKHCVILKKCIGNIDPLFNNNDNNNNTNNKKMTVPTWYSKCVRQ